jgi:hypothetical protein
LKRENEVDVLVAFIPGHLAGEESISESMPSCYCSNDFSLFYKEETEKTIIIAIIVFIIIIWC